MNLIALIDTVALLATLATAGFIIWGRKNALARDATILLALIVAISLFRNASNICESTNITDALDPFEDNVEVFLPLLWAFFFHTLTQNIAAAERADLNRSLAAKNEELQRIVYIASHDLRSPLVNIRGFSHELASNCVRLQELLDKPGPDEQTRRQIKAVLAEGICESVNFISAGAENMERVIDGLLKLSRAGVEELHLQPLDMNHLILSIRQAVTFQIEQKNAALTIGDLPPCLGDENKITQVFSNLIDNALKYLDESRPGQITVTGRQEQDRAVYCVKDNGIGIAPEDQKKVFAAFCRLQHAKSSPGEGLGLNIVARIVERHHGSVCMESEPGRGSAFYVSLPKP
ncbi:MAG: GHKL domain-containing protein [Phycisphaerae bacterium]|nr:GHKL domain-containing protein [Phycisphaerae bacterium]